MKRMMEVFWVYNVDKYVMVYKSKNNLYWKCYDKNSNKCKEYSDRNCTYETGREGELEPTNSNVGIVTIL
jgi:hypothetical protein